MVCIFVLNFRLSITLISEPLLTAINLTQLEENVGTLIFQKKGTSCYKVTFQKRQIRIKNRINTAAIDKFSAKKNKFRFNNVYQKRQVYFFTMHTFFSKIISSARRIGALYNVDIYIWRRRIMLILASSCLYATIHLLLFNVVYRKWNIHFKF